MRRRVDGSSAALHAEGQRLLDWLTAAYEQRGQPAKMARLAQFSEEPAFLPCRIVPYQGIESLQANCAGWSSGTGDERDCFGVLAEPIPYLDFRRRLAEHGL